MSDLLPSKYGHRALEPCGYHDGGRQRATRANTDDRAASRLDGRRAHELRLLAAMAQANGGCDAVLLVEGGVGWSHPLVVYGRE